jgi:hypothetical protein
MTLHVPGFGEFGWVLSSHAATRPAANMGITITPAQNSKAGAYSEYIDGALVLFDVYGIKLNFNTGDRLGASANMIVDIGVDVTAGTSYTVLIPDLLVTHAAPYNIGAGGVWYYFPLFIPAGTSIAARASIDNATVGTLRSMIYLYGKPRYPEQVRVGRRVEALGEVTATSEGTVVVAGGAAEGTYTSMGTLTRDAWWFQCGFGSSDSSLTAGQIYDWDVAVGDATNKRLVSTEPLGRTIITGAAEQVSHVNSMENASLDGKAGQTVYIRGQCSGTVDTDTTCIVYALGG